MREFGSAIETQLASLSGVTVRHLVWIAARSRETGLVEARGFWNGADVRSFSIGGTARQYFGAGALLGVGAITGEVGLQVRMHQLSLSRLPPDFGNLIALYDVRLAPVEVHRVLFDPVKGVPVGDPLRVLKGWVEEMPVPRAAEGGTETVTLTVASASRALTRTLTVRKSDEAQRRVSATDRGREYAAISGAVGVFWGVLNKRGAPPPTAPAPSSSKAAEDWMIPTVDTAGR